MTDTSPEWTKRVEWAQCLDPWKRHLNVLASLWIEGTLNSTEVLQELESEWKSVSYVKAVVMGDAVVDDAESETILARIQSEIMILDTIVRDFEGAGIWERRERLRDVLRSQNRSIPDIQS